MKQRRDSWVTFCQFLAHGPDLGNRPSLIKQCSLQIKKRSENLAKLKDKKQWQWRLQIKKQSHHKTPFPSNSSEHCTPRIDSETLSLPFQCRHREDGIACLKLVQLVLKAEETRDFQCYTMLYILYSPFFFLVTLSLCITQPIAYDDSKVFERSSWLLFITRQIVFSVKVMWKTHWKMHASKPTSILHLLCGRKIHSLIKWLLTGTEYLMRLNSWLKEGMGRDILMISVDCHALRRT